MEFVVDGRVEEMVKFMVNYTYGSTGYSIEGHKLEYLLLEYE